MNPNQSFAGPLVAAAAERSARADCPAARPAAGRREGLTVRDLVTRAGAAPLLARFLSGRMVEVRGYLTPSLAARPAALVVTEGSVAPCQICGGIHDPGAALPVEPAEMPGPDVTLHDAVTVTGRLEVARWRDPDTGDAHAVRVTGGRFARVVPPAAAHAAGARRRPEPAALRDGAGRGRRPSPARPGRGVRAGLDGDRGRRPGTGPADAILVNGRIHTVCEGLGTVEAVAIRDGRFVAVGDREAVDRHAGPETEVVDLGGRTVIPGLIDSHLHQIMLATNLPAVDLLPARSIAEVQRRIGERAAETPDGEWVIASSGWHESILEEGRMPTRWELDEAAPANPVMIPRGGHVVTMSSLALEAAGITDETPDPTGGVIVRDPATGAATGVLLENAAYFARRAAPPPPEREALADLLADAMAMLNSYGIVCVVDPVVDENVIEVYKLLRREGRMTVRTDLLYKARDLAETETGIAVTLAQESDDMLRFPGLKYMLDGGVEGARLHEPYRIVPGEQPHADYRGLLIVPPGGEDELVEAYKRVAEAGLQAQTHGVGDECIDFIAHCYERVAAEIPLDDLNWCLMHVFLPSDEAIEKLKAAGILGTVQNHPVLLGHNQKRWWGDERAAAAIPIRRLIDKGFFVGGGTDGPVVPVDPFLSMWWMTTRGTLKGYVLGPEHAITPAEALTLYTANNAKILGVHEDRGTIEPGKRADLAVLSQDILAVDPDEIRNTKALLTMVGGKVVYRNGA